VNGKVVGIADRLIVCVTLLVILTVIVLLRVNGKVVGIPDRLRVWVRLPLLHIVVVIDLVKGYVVGIDVPLNVAIVGLDDIDAVDVIVIGDGVDVDIILFDRVGYTLVV
jgi:hypothetical protein